MATAIVAQPNLIGNPSRLSIPKTGLISWLTGQGDPIVATSRFSVICAVLVILAAGVLGYTALRDLFISIGLFAPWLGYLFPLLFDLAEVTAAISVFNAQLLREEDRFAWRMVLLFTALGIVANIAHAAYAWTIGRIDAGQMTIAIFATSLFPLSVALVTHLLKKVITRSIHRRGLLDSLADLTARRQTLTGEAQTLTSQVESLRAEVEALRQAKKSNDSSILASLGEANEVRAANKQKAMTDLLDYLARHPYASLTETGQAIGRSKTTAGNYINELTEAGQLHRNGQGWEVVK